MFRGKTYRLNTNLLLLKNFEILFVRYGTFFRIEVMQGCFKIATSSYFELKTAKYDNFEACLHDFYPKESAVATKKYLKIVQ